MHSSVLLLLVASGLLGVAFSQTTIPEQTEVPHETVSTMKHHTGIWVKSTELPTKPTGHFWSLPKLLSTKLDTGLSSHLPATKLTESTVVAPIVTISETPRDSTDKFHSLPMDDDCKMAYEMAKKNNDIALENLKISELLKNLTVEDLEENSCKIELTSVSYTSPTAPLGRGLILVNGEKCGECNTRMSGYDAKPGLSICVIHPIDCRIVDKRHFRTEDPKNEHEGKYLKMFIDNLGDHLTVAGTSCGDSISGLGIGKTILKVLNAPVDDVKKYGKYAFVVQTKETSKGLIVTENPSGDKLKVTFKLTGENSLRYQYKKENP